MGILGWVLAAGVAGFVIKKIRQNAIRSAEYRAEQEKRRNTPCRFVDGFSASEFEQMANLAGRSIRRLSKVTVDGPVVYGVVHSQSGISEWNFKLDFNDYGHITGAYWLSSDNDDSSIPERFAELIQSAIKNYSIENEFEEDEKPEYDFKDSSYCPYCRKRNSVSNAPFCAYCGNKLR